MIKKKRDFILDTLEQMYPDAHCELNHSNVFQLLVAVMLSAQTTDRSVNQLTSKLFMKYQSIEDFANASLEELENDLKTIGLYRNKAKSISITSKKILHDYNGVVPQSKEELIKLPGVGGKTANVVLSVGFGIPALAVDTHVERISKRLGFAKEEDSVIVVEKKLCKTIPKSRWNRAHHQFIFFGRYFCKAKNPNCAVCPFIEICKERK